MFAKRNPDKSHIIQMTEHSVCEKPKWSTRKHCLKRDYCYASRTPWNKIRLSTVLGSSVLRATLHKHHYSKVTY